MYTNHIALMDTPRAIDTHLGKVELLGLERPILGQVVEAVLVLVDVGIGVALRRQTMSVKYE